MDPKMMDKQNVDGLAKLPGSLSLQCGRQELLINREQSLRTHEMSLGSTCHHERFADVSFVPGMQF